MYKCHKTQRSLEMGAKTEQECVTEFYDVKCVNIRRNCVIFSSSWRLKSPTEYKCDKTGSDVICLIALPNYISVILKS